MAAAMLIRTNRTDLHVTRPISRHLTYRIVARTFSLVLLRYYALFPYHYARLCNGRSYLDLDDIAPTASGPPQPRPPALAHFRPQPPMYTPVARSPCRARARYWPAYDTAPLTLLPGSALIALRQLVDCHLCRCQLLRMWASWPVARIQTWMRRCWCGTHAPQLPLECMRVMADTGGRPCRWEDNRAGDGAAFTAQGVCVAPSMEDVGLL